MMGAIGPLIKGDLNDGHTFGPAVVLTLTIVEAVVGHLYALLLLLFAYSDCTRPSRSRAWVMQWRFQLVVYAVLVSAAELGWVQLGWLLDPAANAAVCTWTPNMLLVWTVVGLFNLLILLAGTWLMKWCHAPQESIVMALFVCILVRAQSAGIGAVVMTLTGTDDGPCGMMILPLLVMSVGSFVAISAMCAIAPCRIAPTPIFGSIPMMVDSAAMPITPEEEAAKAAREASGTAHTAVWRGRGGTGNGDVETGRVGGESWSDSTSGDGDDDGDDGMDAVDLNDDDDMDSIDSPSCFGCRRSAAAAAGAVGAGRRKPIRLSSARRFCVSCVGKCWCRGGGAAPPRQLRSIGMRDLRFAQTVAYPHSAEDEPTAPDDDDDDDDDDNGSQSRVILAPQEGREKGKELVEGVGETEEDD